MEEKREKIKTLLLGMEKALTEYHEFADELERVSNTVTPEEDEILVNDQELAELLSRVNDLE